MNSKRTWKEFQASGLLWWVNMLLHTFGWAITLIVDDETGEITDSYPARVTYRGFSEKDNDEGYKKATNYMLNNIYRLKRDIED